MKNWVLLFTFQTILLVSSIGSAEMALEKSGDLKPGACYLSKDLGYTIIQKIDDNHYELRGDGIAFEPHALLQTNKAIFESMGHPVGIGMKHVGDKKMKLENGFSATYQLWEECKYDESVECIPVHDPSLAWPHQKKKKADCSAIKAGSVQDKIEKSKPGKSADCQNQCFDKKGKDKLKEGETLEECLRNACK